MLWEVAPVGDGGWTGDSGAETGGALPADATEATGVDEVGEELGVRGADGAGAVVAWLPLAASAI